MNGSGKTRGLIWKEWREKRWILATLAGLIALFPLLVAPAMPVAAPLPKDWADLAWLLWAPFGVGVLILGAMLFSAEEHDPARGFLYTLPISRGAILGDKLKTLGLSWLLLAAVAAAATHLHVGNALDGEAWALLGSLVCFGALLTTLSVILGLHFRAVIVTLVVVTILALPLVPVLFTEVFVGDFRLDLAVSLVLRCAIGVAALTGWLFFLFCRTGLQELQPTPRALLGLLFIVAALEVFATAFLCDWRDLAFILFGI
jgi:hypothetical protein